jgi:cephalosporin-C deacetylase-like acetyl esterase
MKYQFYLTFILVLLCNSEGGVKAQNLLPYDWNIRFLNTASVASRNAKAESEINLLLSWERQGYFATDGDCMLTSTFNVENIRMDYILTSRLQCDIQNIRINGKIVVSDLKNQFWKDRDACTRITISKHLLHKGKNDITILCSALGYTGGLSHNLLTLTPVKGNNKEHLYITLATANHVCLGDDKMINLHCTALRKATLRLRIENDFHQLQMDSVFTVTPKDTIIRLDLNKRLAKPGFYQITAVMHGVGYSGNAQWMAVRPEEISCNNKQFPEFDEYWATAKAELATIVPDFRMHKVDSLSNKGTRDVYIVEMQSLNNLTIRGYYFVPRTAGKHIAVLQVPGYGWGFENIDDLLKAKTDRIELALCVRGHGISADVFHPGFGTPGIWGYKLCNSDSVAYRGIYMDCVRAVEFLYSRKEVNNRCIGVKGGSQGGGLTLATAGLCADKIAACAYFDPFPCDTRDQLRLRTICVTELKNSLAYYNNCSSFRDMMNIQDLIDTRSFASKIQCPVLYTTALFDDDCHPHGGFAAYNLIHSNKQYKVFPNDGHIEGFTHDAMIMSWLDNILESKK